jgi:hypothetical protein
MERLSNGDSGSGNSGRIGADAEIAEHDLEFVVGERDLARPRACRESMAAAALLASHAALAAMIE